MKYFAYVWIDIKRLLRSKATWAVVAVIALSPLLTLLTGLSGQRFGHVAHLPVCQPARHERRAVQHVPVRAVLSL